MDILDKITSGFHRFQKHYYIDKAKLMARLRQGQSPKALVIACCDSRVHPDTLFDTELGDLFVVRNIANIVSPHTAQHSENSVTAALTFAVLHLNVAHIIVLGHSQCGGIKRLMEKAGATTAIDLWLQQGLAVRKDVLARYANSSPAEQCYQCELAGIKHALNNLHSYPWIKQRIEDGLLRTHGWYFDIKQGALLRLESQRDQFVPMQTEAKK